jgi:hypothetical protein
MILCVGYTLILAVLRKKRVSLYSQVISSNHGVNRREFAHHLGTSDGFFLLYFGHSATATGWLRRIVMRLRALVHELLIVLLVPVEVLTAREGRLKQDHNLK